MSKNRRLFRAAVAAAVFTFSGVAAPFAAPADEAETPAHRAMDVALAHYVALCTDLAADKTDALAGHVRALDAALAAVGKTSGSDAASEKIRALARESAGALAASRDALTKASTPRPLKGLVPVSKPLVRYVGWFRAGGKPWKTYYCSMAKGSWLQPASDAKLANPYYGKKMLRCGDAVRTRGEPIVAQ